MDNRLFATLNKKVSNSIQNIEQSSANSNIIITFGNGQIKEIPLTGSVNGKSAYEIAVENGYIGNEKDWLESLKGINGVNGSNGKNGLSAYEIAKQNGFDGTEEEWLESLKVQVEGIQSDWNETDVESNSYIKNKPSIPINLSELNNDTNFINNTVNNLVNYYLKTEIYSKEEFNKIIGRLSSIQVSIVNSLPISDILTNTIYMIETDENSHIYNQYMYINSNWASLGSTSIDLSNYYNKTEIDKFLNNKVDKVQGKSLSTNDLTNTLKQSYDNTVLKAHEHNNVELLDSYTQTNEDIKDSIEKKHEHLNFNVINKFSEDTNGKLLYNNLFISNDENMNTILERSDW